MAKHPRPEDCIREGLSFEQSLQVLADARGDDDIVVSNQMSARVWPNFSRHALDFNYRSSTMGGAIPLGLGLAMAKPSHEVIVLSGDGSLLMSLGCLTTIAASGATNLTIVLFENGLYEVTGSQRTAGCLAGIDYAGMARAAGIPRAEAIETMERWKKVIESRRHLRGPRFYSLRVRQVESGTARWTTTEVDVELRRIRMQLGNVDPGHGNHLSKET